MCSKCFNRGKSTFEAQKRGCSLQSRWERGLKKGGVSKGEDARSRSQK